ncbi:hypothetical protein ACIPC1_16460 [Streptomyces sp. NPDC087263]|uniref:hypothetical protein n=1 Tax=Streptomyces sp. NPDC087263 TaxID=3365773 RepID=UPI0037F3974D
MSGQRSRVAGIAVPRSGSDVGDATTHHLLYGLLPGWFTPGPADGVTHRRTRIEQHIHRFLGSLPLARSPP